MTETPGGYSRDVMQTIQHLETPAQGRAAIWSRRGFLALLVLIVVAGLAGLLGVHTATGSAAEGDWSLSLRHASVARAGLDVPWDVTVTHAGGFGKQVTLAITADYFGIYESQRFWPEPSDETRDGDTVYLTFSAPAKGDTFKVSYDAYIQPASQIGRSGSISVLDAGERVATVDFSTRLLP